MYPSAQLPSVWRKCVHSERLLVQRSGHLLGQLQEHRWFTAVDGKSRACFLCRRFETNGIYFMSQPLVRRHPCAASSGRVRSKQCTRLRMTWMCIVIRRRAPLHVDVHLDVSNPRQRSSRDPGSHTPTHPCHFREAFLYFGHVPTLSPLNSDAGPSPRRLPN